MIGNPQGRFSTYDRLSTRVRTAVDECVCTYHREGKEAAEVEFRRIVDKHNLVRWEMLSIGNTVRTRLAQLGYLPTGGE